MNFLLNPSLHEQIALFALKNKFLITYKKHQNVHLLEALEKIPSTYPTCNLHRTQSHCFLAYSLQQ